MVEIRATQDSTFSTSLLGSRPAIEDASTAPSVGLRSDSRPVTASTAMIPTEKCRRAGPLDRP